MHKILLLFIGLFVSINVYSQSESYEIKQKISDYKQGKNNSYTATWKVNDAKALMEIDYMGTGEANLVLLPKNNALLLYSLSSTEKVYQKVETKDSKETISIIKTESKAKIKTYHATKYILKSKTREIEFWFTEELKINFKAIASIFNNSEFIKIASELPNGFILSYSIKENGLLVTQADLISATETSFNPKVFEIPLGYTLK